MITFALAACASPRVDNSERHGLFDRWESVAGSKSSRQQKAQDDEAPQFVRHTGVIRATAIHWVWPMSAMSVTSGFGRRDGSFHQGVDLRASSGTPVYGVENGTVVYAASNIGGYGRMVVVRHGKDLFSIYAHLQKYFVKKGQAIRRGQQIAFSGQSGRASGPHLHFEVRSGLIPLNPMQILPVRNHLASYAQASLPSSVHQAR